MMRELDDDLRERRPLDVSDDQIASELYAAMCNMRWTHTTYATSDEPWSCTWRAAGQIVAELRRQGESYLDWYLSGGEGTVTDRVYLALEGIGWTPVPWE